MIISRNCSNMIIQFDYEKERKIILDALDGIIAFKKDLCKYIGNTTEYDKKLIHEIEALYNSEKNNDNLIHEFSQHEWRIIFTACKVMEFAIKQTLHYVFENEIKNEIDFIMSNLKVILNYFDTTYMAYPKLKDKDKYLRLIDFTSTSEIDEHFFIKNVLMAIYKYNKNYNFNLIFNFPCAI